MATKNLKVLMSGDTKPYRAEINQADVATKVMTEDIGEQMNSLAEIFGANMGTIGQSAQKISTVFQGLLASFSSAAAGGSAFALASAQVTAATNAVAQTEARLAAANTALTVAQGTAGISAEALAAAQLEVTAASAATAAAQRGLATAQAASAVATGLGTKALQILKVALISTGVGALVVALGTLIAYFTQTERGAEFVERAMAGLKAAFKVLIDRAAGFGEGLVKIFSGDFQGGWDALKGSVKGVGTEMMEEAKAASALELRFQALEDAEKQLELVNSERRAKARELFALSKDEETSAVNKRKYILEAMALEKLAFNDEKVIAKEKLDIHTQQVAMGEARDEQNYKTLELQGAINNLSRDAANTEISYSKALKGANKEILANAEAITKQIEAKRKADGEGLTVGLKMKNPTLTAKVTTVTDDKMFTDNIEKSQKQMDAVYRKTWANMDHTEKTFIDMSSSIQGALADAAVGTGEWLGNLMNGQGSLEGFGQMIAGVFADMAINVGKSAILTGTAMLGIKAALKFGNPFVAIAAGIALVAFGTMMKGRLSAMADGGGTGAMASGGGGQNFNYDTRGNTAQAQAQKVNITVAGEFKLQNKVLVAGINQENTRMAIST